jgi:hypothetical protein
VFKIDNSGEDITLQLQAGDQTPGTHWMLDNQTYVLDCASGNGQVRVWKWNGNDAPAVTGSANVGASTGNVQAVSFDNDNAGIAYVFGRAAANEGDVYKIDLTNASAVKLFKVPRYAEDKAITGIWTIQAETRGDNKYFVFGGSIYAPARGQTGDSKHGVFWVKNPPSNGAEIADASIFDTISDFPTAVRTMKTFKASNGDVFYAAKNYTSNPIAEADYRLRLIKIDN